MSYRKSPKVRSSRLLSQPIHHQIRSRYVDIHYWYIHTNRQHFVISVAKCCLVCFTKVSNVKAVASIITNVVHTRFQTIVHMADDAVHQLICPYPTVPMERMASWWPLVLHHRQHHRLVMSVNYHRQPCQPCLPFRNRVTSTFNEQHPHLVHCPQMMWSFCRLPHHRFVKDVDSFRIRPFVPIHRHRRSWPLVLAAVVYPPVSIVAQVDWTEL